MMNPKSLLPVLLVPSCLLAIPAAAMLFNVEGWAWSAFDFVVGWLLVAGTVLVYKLLASRCSSRAYRIAAGIAAATGLMLVWINGAVGLIGSEDNPANRMYAGVLVIGAVGAVIARLEPLGMARALFAMAGAQFLVPVAALILWRTDFSPGVPQVFGLNFVFVLLFAGSAFLFRQAGQPGAGDTRMAA